MALRLAGVPSPTSTLTVTLLVTLPPRGSAIVAWSRYWPLCVNDAMASLAALVPLGENTTAAGGVPTTDQL